MKTFLLGSLEMEATAMCEVMLVWRKLCLLCTNETQSVWTNDGNSTLADAYSTCL